jgi:hypothetical protein
MTLTEALINQGQSLSEALETIARMKEDVDNGCDPEDVLHEEGLEPDYVIDLLEDML